ncbi:hypothetical protein N7535_005749 [Penicillium sp. DV-2018c]|nr:hypothetical protein N7461_009324 [Penicillium sp. DV-2018c]KAJ5572089.1 hypothetical protein N7535_005749 [Penicillium sp. DV-2018c]
MSDLKIPFSLHTPIPISSLATHEIIEKDENEAIEKSNILKGDRLRHAKPRTSNKYNEGPDEDDLPAEA